MQKVPELRSSLQLEFWTLLDISYDTALNSAYFAFPQDSCLSQCPEGVSAYDQLAKAVDPWSNTDLFRLF